MKLKKITAVILSAAMLLLLAACGNSAGGGSGNNVSVGQTETTAERIDTSAEAETVQNQTEPDSEPVKETSNVGSIVVCFSGTGNTREIAEQLAQALDTDVLEIEPQEPYTDEDLNYNNDDCRANQEMNDDSARPAIANDLSAVTEYDTVYLGYPIWWGTAPRIIQTFLERYDLGGKTIYTFCTSGGSGIGQSISDLSEAYTNINILSGHRFHTGDSAEAVQEWLDSLK